MAFASTRDVITYDDLKTEFKRDPLGIMEQAADDGLTTSQLVNRVSPSTLVEQKRNVMARIIQDEGLSLFETDVSRPSRVDEFTRDPWSHVAMFDYLHNLSMKPYRKFNKQRQSIVMPNEAPVDTPTNAAVTGSITVDKPVGMT